MISIMDQNLLSNQTQICSDAKSVLESSYFEALATLEVIIGLSAIPLNLIFLLVINRVGYFHSNLRLLLGYLCFNLFFYSTANSWKIIAILSPTESCALGMSLYDCRIQELVLMIPNLNSLYILVFILIERFYATVRHTIYDRPRRDGKKRRPYLALSMIVILTVIIGLIAAIICQNALARGDEQRIVFGLCDTNLSLDSLEATAISIPNIVVELAALTLSIYIYARNRYIHEHMAINRSVHSLTSRFQIDQNVKVNRVLVPSLILHVACFLPTYLVVLFLFGRAELETGTKIFVAHLMYTMKLVYALLHPILIISRNVHVRKEFVKVIMRVRPKFVEKCFRRTTTNVQQAPIQNAGTVGAAAHFQILEQVWAMEAYKKQQQGGGEHYGRGARKESVFVVRTAV